MNVKYEKNVTNLINLYGITTKNIIILLHQNAPKMHQIAPKLCQNAPKWMILVVIIVIKYLLEKVR